MNKMAKRFLVSCLLLIFTATPLLSATEKWIAGATSSATTICGTEINSLASSGSASNAVVCTTVVSNGTNLDLYMTVSVSLGSVTSGAGSPYVGVYVYPLNQDGSTYGDGQFGSSAVGPPPSNYMGCSIPAPASVTAAIVGSCMTAIPPSNFKIVFYNNLLVNMAASANTVKFQTFNRQVN